MKYTLAVTSCDRFDLLKQTLESFGATADILPEHTVIVDDSDAAKPDWVSQLGNLGPITWISNGRRRGQIFTLDVLYDHIETEYVFHTEDDWLYSHSDFIAQSKAMLDAYPHFWSVSLRGDDCNGHPVVPDPISDFSINLPGWREGWGGCHFNPGLRRMSDYQRIGSYGRHAGYGVHGCGHELDLSKMHLDMGYRIAALPKTIEHLGRGKSKAIWPVPAHPKVLIAVPATHNYEYGKHSLRVPRVTDGRVQAIRDTWFRDAAKFPNVTARFFYGGTPRGDFEALQDEVYLDVPDDYERLADKIQGICRYALDNGFEYLVKCDDDTLLYVDRLLRSGFDSVHQMGWYGCPHKPGQRCECYSTGMCYTLNRQCMELIVAAPITHWAEDLWVGRVLRAAGIRPTGHPGWLPGYDKHYVDFPLPPKVVAAHSVRPADMYRWHSTLQG